MAGAEAGQLLATFPIRSFPAVGGDNRPSLLGNSRNPILVAGPGRRDLQEVFDLGLLTTSDGDLVPQQSNRRETNALIEK